MHKITASLWIHSWYKCRCGDIIYYFRCQISPSAMHNCRWIWELFFILNLILVEVLWRLLLITNCRSGAICLTLQNEYLKSRMTNKLFEMSVQIIFTIYKLSTNILDHAWWHARIIWQIIKGYRSPYDIITWLMCWRFAHDTKIKYKVQTLTEVK